MMQEQIILAFMAVFILALLCGLLSPLLIAGKMAFMGASVSHSTFVGLALSLSFFSPEESYSIYGLTLLTTLIFALLLSALSFKEHLPFDSLVGVFFSVSMALGVMIFYFFGEHREVDFHDYLFGDILLLRPEDVIIALVHLVLVSTIIFFLFRKWIYFIIDSEGAQVAGQRSRAFHFCFIILLSLSVVSLVKLAGIILINTMLLVPGIFSLKTAHSMKETIVYSIIFSLVSSLMGLAITHAWSTPPGPTISLTQFLLFLLFVLGKKTAGLLHHRVS